MKVLQAAGNKLNGGTRVDDPFALEEWIAASKKGIPVIVAEFGVYNRVPHDVAMAVQEAKLKAFKEAGFGWCLWSFKGEFGPFNPKRQGIPLEQYRGMAVDRKYLDLLKNY